MDINNKELELNLIGAVLNNNANLVEVVEMVTPDMFIQENLAHYWQTITRLANEGKDVNAITVGAEHSETNLLAMEHIASSRLATDSMVKEAAKMVKRQALRRHIEKIGYEIQSEAATDAQDSDLIDSIQSKVMALETNTGRYKVSNMIALLGQCSREFQERALNGNQVIGIPSGFRDIDDRIYGYRQGDLVIIAARPSMGKTNFLLNIAKHNALKGKKGVIFSLEMPAEQMLERMIADAGNADYGKMRKGDSSIGEDYVNGVTILSKHAISIYDEPSITPQKATAILRKEKQKLGNIDFIGIDYLQLMTAAKANNRTDEIGQISRALKRMAKEFECPVFALSQLNRGLEQRVNKRPVMSDLRESGDIEQDADVIHFLYADDVYDPNSERQGLAEVITAKFRAGEKGTDVLQKEFHYCRFKDLSVGYEIPEIETKKKVKGFAG
jgi:replicative DNA helicase